MVARTDYNSTTDSLHMYWRDISHCEPLSREAEIELVIRAHAGDESAMQALVSANLRFVVSVARDYARSDIPLAELISAGNMGLLRAVSTFDETRGLKFITYAVWWVRQAICKTMDQISRDVRRPSNQLLDMKQIERETRKLEQVLGRPPSVEELIEQTGYLPARVRNAVESGWGEISLDLPAGPDQEDVQLNLLPFEGENADEDYERHELRDLLRQSMASLDARECQVLDAYFGLGGRESMSLERIGDGLGLTRERVRQIRDRALEKMRMRHGVELGEFCRN
ncbi:MAG: RNA polymerase primary sigma factor [Candidatus Latescibacterota bacterium]|jgi:RNA polymerase primary sigma factor